VEWPPAGDDTFFENFLEQVRRHGVEALVYRLLKLSSKWDAISGRVRDEPLQALRFQAVVEMVRSLDLLALLVAKDNFINEENANWSIEISLPLTLCVHRQAV
jgi:hypothetical protein